MLKLRNAVLTALLAFCLAMPFVSCSFNDGATGDVSGDVKVQSDNNQNGGNENPSGGDNGGNGGSTGGNEKPSGGDEDSGDNGNENPSGGNNGGSGNENPSGGNEKPTDPTEPGAGTTYVVIYNGDIIEESLPESKWFYGVEKVNLEEGVDYTMKENKITLTDSGYQKVLPLLGSSGGDGGQEVIPPVTDGPVTDGPVTDVHGDGKGTYTVMYNGQPLVDENGEVVKIPAAALDYYKTILSEGDYTINGNVITLTDSGLKKVMDAGAGEGGGHGGIPPVTDGPVTDGPVTDGPVPDVPSHVEGTKYTVMYNGSPVTYPDGEPITFIGDQDDISYEAKSLGLDASDYTIEGTYIILNEAGNAKVQQMLDSHGNI